jgi:Ser/Thr protein kinase RdoA (MazF antagonist)
MSQILLQAYGLEGKSIQIEFFGGGLINKTWKVSTPHKEYIFQRVNDQVFKQPAYIDANIKLIADYLKKNHPDYCFVAPIATKKGEGMIQWEDEGYYRLFPFVDGSHSKDVVESSEQAYEAALQFGRFTRLLGGLDVSRLKVTIPEFHDITLRYQQFLKSLETGNVQRIKETKELIQWIKGHNEVVTAFNQFKPCFKLRVTHHDTKINNILFDARGKGICVIDLDTVMPGYFISDVGDMMRTYLSPVSEEETDFEKIEVRDEFYKAIVEGYLHEMKDELNAKERQCFFYAGKFIIYMQAIRFLTDYINDDIYYGAAYPEHNLVRAKNQAVLLQRLLEKESLLSSY